MIGGFDILHKKIMEEVGKRFRDSLGRQTYAISKPNKTHYQYIDFIN